MLAHARVRTRVHTLSQAKMQRWTACGVGCGGTDEDMTHRRRGWPRGFLRTQKRDGTWPEALVSGGRRNENALTPLSARAECLRAHTHTHAQLHSHVTKSSFRVCAFTCMGRGACKDTKHGVPTRTSSSLEYGSSTSLADMMNATRCPDRVAFVPCTKSHFPLLVPTLRVPTLSFLSNKFIKNMFWEHFF